MAIQSSRMGGHASGAVRLRVAFALLAVSSIMRPTSAQQSEDINRNLAATYLGHD